MNNKKVNKNKITTDIKFSIIFCDDIREEKDNKITYVGSYSDVILVNSFPVLLPKLGIGIKYYNLNDDVKGSIELKYDEKVENLEVDLKISELVKSKSQEYFSGNFNVLLSPFLVNEPGRLSVSFIINDHKTFIGSLDVLMID